MHDDTGKITNLATVTLRDIGSDVFFLPTAALCASIGHAVVDSRRSSQDPGMRAWFFIGHWLTLGWNNRQW